MYDADCPACSETYATFHIVHDDLDPDAGSQQLELQPTEAIRKGDVRNPKARRPYIYKRGGWRFRTESVVQSRDIRRHVDWLLDQLEPSSAQLKRLQAEGYEMEVFCYWVCAGEHGGPRLSPSQMRRLADLGIEIGFDIYFTGDDED